MGNSKTMNMAISATEAVVILGEDALLITLEDAKQIRYALLDYLEDNKEALEVSIPAVLLSDLYAPLGPAIIDSTGTVKIGPWMLEAQTGQLQLAIRPIPFQPGKVNYRCIALLVNHETDVDDPWQVSKIDVQKIFPR